MGFFSSTSQKDKIKTLSDEVNTLEDNIEKLNKDLTKNKTNVEYVQGMINQIHSSYATNSSINTIHTELNKKINNINNTMFANNDGNIKYCATPNNPASCVILGKNTDINTLQKQQDTNRAAISDINSQVSNIKSGDFIPTKLVLQDKMLTGATAAFVL